MAGMEQPPNDHRTKGARRSMSLADCIKPRLDGLLDKLINSL